jgi:predicted RNase H-like HicB family nuclease
MLAGNDRRQLLRGPLIFNDADCCMKAEVTAIIEPAPEGGYWAVCPEFPGANGQGETLAEARESLRQAIQLLIEDRLEDYCRGLPDEAIKEPLILS